MSIDEHLDAYDPIRRSYRDYWLKLKVCVVVIAMLAGVVAFAGVPHLQTDYWLYQERRLGRMPTASEKRAAIYLGPAGRRCVRDGQYGNRGCPVVLWVPISDLIAGENDHANDSSL